MNIIWRRLAVAAVAMVAGSMMSVSMAREAWWMEAEDKASTFTVNDGTIDIIATKGVTLWNNNLMEGNTIIEYEARIVSDPRFKDEKGDIRTSDLNCFWMAERRGGCGGKLYGIRRQLEHDDTLQTIHGIPYDDGQRMAETGDSARVY